VSRKFSALFHQKWNIWRGAMRPAQAAEAAVEGRRVRCACAIFPAAGRFCTAVACGRHIPSLTDTPYCKNPYRPLQKSETERIRTSHRPEIMRNGREPMETQQAIPKNLNLLSRSKFHSPAEIMAPILVSPLHSLVIAARWSPPSRTRPCIELSRSTFFIHFNAGPRSDDTVE
jgi:hypothetical protein